MHAADSSLVESSETFGIPESDRGGVGTVHCCRKVSSAGSENPCGCGDCCGVIHCNCRPSDGSGTEVGRQSMRDDDDCSAAKRYRRSAWETEIDRCRSLILDRFWMAPRLSTAAAAWLVLLLLLLEPVAVRDKAMLWERKRDG